MEKPTTEKQKWFVIEHMEEWLFEWCTCEYIQATEYLSKRNNILLVSNFQVVLDNTSEENKTNLETLFSTLSAKNLTSHIFFMSEPIRTAINPNTQKFCLNELSSIDPEQKDLINSNQSQEFCLKSVSLLDLRAKKALDHSDRQELNVLIFGGILGDHPPRDRTKPLREFLGDNMRHLGPVQMSTDTAILTSQIILADGVELGQIPFVDAPEVVSPTDPDHAIDLEGFRYVSKQYNLATGEVGSQKSLSVYMHPKIRNELLFEEFDFGNMELA
jgi:ribosome biogenesis SPOUT family RNA methylase Rps3